MAIIVELYNFSKKENSTAQPNRANASSFNCILKDECGVVNPTIILDIGLNDSPSSYNYAYIPSFNRYYWIEEWTNVHPRWIASLKVDALATYKTAIGNSDLYVLRASAEYDGDIIDMLYPTKITSTYNRTVKTVLNNDFANGVFVIGVVNELGRFGSIDYYIVDGTGLDNLTYYLVHDAIKDQTNGFTINDCSIALQKSLIDPLSYIKSAIFLPIDRGDLPIAQTRNIKIMGWDTGVVGRVIYPNNDIVSYNFDFDLQKHPQTASRGLFCNSSPYTIHTIKYQPFGEVVIENLSNLNVDSIRVSIDIELHTGASVMTVKNSNVILNRLVGQLGVDISLSQTTRDYIGATQHVLDAIGGVARGVMTGDASSIIGVSSNILSGVQTIQPKVYSQGSNGNLIYFNYPLELESRFFTLVDDDITSNGRPLCKIRKPKNIGGYMLIQDADVSINGTSQELSTIRSYLEGGFYYE